MKLLLLATYGEVLERGSGLVPQNDREKDQFRRWALGAGFWAALLILAVALRLVIGFYPQHNHNISTGPILGCVSVHMGLLRNRSQA
jgi:uncharacterized membrane protein